MTALLVLDPTPDVVSGDGSAGPGLGRLAGKVVGLRRDSWLAWDYVIDEWAGLLERDGARTVVWRHVKPVGKEAEHILEQFGEFLDGVDGFVSGLATCGGCTMFTVHDAMIAIGRSIPTVVGATTHFVDLARALSRRAGAAEIRVQELPYPLQGLPEERVRQIARDSYEAMLVAFGAEV